MANDGNFGYYTGGNPGPVTNSNPNSNPAPQPPAGSYVINPGSVYQTYNPAIGQTTYPNAPASFVTGALPTTNGINYGISTPGAPNGSVVPGVAPTVQTPTGIPNNTQVFQPNGKYADVKVGTELGLPSESVSDKAGTIVGQKEKQNIALQKVQENLANPSLLNKQANDAFIQGAIMAKFGRSASKEELGLVAGSPFNLKGLTVSEVAKKIGLQTPPGNIPGSNPGSPDTNIPADQTIGLPDGTIDPVKMMAQIETDLKGINDLIAQEREAFDTSVLNIGNQPGVAMPLIQGQQAYQNNLKEVRLNRLLDEKKAVLDSADIKMKVYDYARQLRQDQQQAMGSIISTFLSAGVPISDSLAQQYSKLTGINAKALTDGFAVATANWKAEQLKGQTEVVNLQDGNGNTYSAMFNKTTGAITPISPTSNPNYTAPEPIGTGSGADYIKSLGGTITQGFDTPTNYIAGRTTHGGYDIALPENTPIKAPVVGKVVGITKDNGKGTGWGNSVVIQDASGNQWRLGHFNQTTVGMGEQVSGSTVLGYSGNTGKVMGENGGYHLHIEAKDSKGNLIDIGKQGSTKPNAITISQEAKNFADAINKKQMTFSQIKGVNDKDTARLQKEVAQALGDIPQKTLVDNTMLDKNITLIDDLLNSKGLNSAVGPTVLTRHSMLDWLTGQKQNFVAGVNTLVSNEALNALIQAKAKGATFGALSDRELDILSSASNKLGSWAVKNGSGKVVSYATSQSAFKEELSRLKKSYEALKKANPSGLQLGSTAGQTLIEKISSDPQKAEEYNILKRDNPTLTDEQLNELL